MCPACVVYCVGHETRNLILNESKMFYQSCVEWAIFSSEWTVTLSLFILLRALEQGHTHNMATKEINNIQTKNK